MSELKWGDKVEVTLDQREFFKRIFLYEYPNGDCECVGAENETYFEEKIGFKTCCWDVSRWRPITEKKIIPFDFSDAEKLIGRAVKYNESNTKYLILQTKLNSICLYDWDMSYSFLMENFTFLDGSPCGKEV